MSSYECKVCGHYSGAHTFEGHKINCRNCPDAHCHCTCSEPDCKPNHRSDKAR